MREYIKFLLSMLPVISENLISKNTKKKSNINETLKALSAN